MSTGLAVFALMKIPALTALAPMQSEPPFPKRVSAEAVQAV
jgi:hypothetical protein